MGKSWPQEYDKERYGKTNKEQSLIMALTKAELEFMTKVPSRLGGIEKQLERIADLLERCIALIDATQKTVSNTELSENEQT